MWKIVQWYFIIKNIIPTLGFIATVIRKKTLFIPENERNANKTEGLYLCL